MTLDSTRWSLRVSRRMHFVSFQINLRYISNYIISLLISTEEPLKTGLWLSRLLLLLLLLQFISVDLCDHVQGTMDAKPWSTIRGHHGKCTDFACTSKIASAGSFTKTCSDKVECVLTCSTSTGASDPRPYMRTTTANLRCIVCGTCTMLCPCSSDLVM
jgi:hypothetical protein